MFSLNYRKYVLKRFLIAKVIQTFLYDKAVPHAFRANYLPVRNETTYSIQNQSFPRRELFSFLGGSDGFRRRCWVPPKWDQDDPKHDSFVDAIFCVAFESIGNRFGSVFGHKRSSYLGSFWESPGRPNCSKMPPEASKPSKT